MSESDERLMQRCAQGDKVAFEALAARYRPRLIAMAQKWLGCPRSADEAAQDVLVAAFSRRQQYQHRGPFAAWLFTLAANHLRDLARASRRRRAALGVLTEAAEPTGIEQSALDGSALWDALGGLPPTQRAALLLHDLYGFDYEEIAALFGVPTGTARSWASRARQEARRRLEASEFGNRRKKP